MLRTVIAPALLAAGLMLITGTAQAQCKSFAKNKCVPGLLPYKFNETFNGATLAPGDEAEVALTFFSGQEYRVMVCVHQILGEVNWKLVDQNNKTVFESLADEPKTPFRFQSREHDAVARRGLGSEQVEERYGAHRLRGHHGRLQE
ncbi:MAG: hypothetical protein IPJ85_15550 [Flavobacteriales bacterium]|nr:hypothetical protein [Flavobacteriales bacterium]